MPTQYFPVFNKRTGKSYEMPWEGDSPPDRLTVKAWIDEQERPKSLWEKVNQPLTDLPSRAAKKISEPLLEYSETRGDSPLKTMARYGGAFTQATGDVLSNMTSPVSLGLTALTGGSGTVARMGAPNIGRGMAALARGAGAAQVGHGLYQAYEAPDTAGQVGGLVEAGLGGLGMATPMPGRKPPPPIPDINMGPRRLGPMPEPERIPINPNTARAYPPNEYRNRWTEGEFYESPTPPPPPAPRQLPPAPPEPPPPPAGLPRRGGSSYVQPEPPPPDPMGHKFFQGERGTSDLLGDVDTGPSLSTSPSPTTRRNLLRNFGRGPSRANEGYYGAGAVESPVEPSIPDVDPILEAGPVRESPIVNTEPAPPQEVVSNRPFERTDDASVEFLAQSGDAEAARELKLRAAPLTSPRPPVRPPRPRPPAPPPPAPPMVEPPPAQAMAPPREQMQFKTTAGSTYTIGEGGRTSRVRDAETLTPDKTVYVDEGTINRAQQFLKRQQGNAYVDVLPDGSVGIMVRDTSGQVKPAAIIGQNTTPERGLHPVEVWGKDAAGKRKWHFGNAITGVFKRIMESDETGAIGNIKRLKYERAKAKRKGTPPPDRYDAGLTGEEPEPLDILKQLFDSLKERGKKLSGDEKGFITIPGVDKIPIPKFLRDKDLPEQFQEWVGTRQANRFKYKGDPSARKVANDIARERFRGWLAGKGYIDPNARGIRFNTTAPEDLVKAYRNLISQPNELGQKWADRASYSKNMALSAGIPYTGVNAHGFNLLARSVIMDPARALKMGKYLVNPADAWKRFQGLTSETSAARDFQGMRHTAEWAIRKGLTLSTEGHEIGTTGSMNLNIGGRTFRKFMEWQGKTFEDPLFQQVLPTVKLKHFNDLVEDLIADGIPREQAGRQAAKFTNNLYGGINWEMLGANKDVQNFKRMLILAPDWLSTNFRLGKGAARSLLDPETPMGKQYQRMIGGIFAAYAAANVVNYAINGQFMPQNDPGHALHIKIGTSDGKNRYFAPFGTALDFVRLPLEVGASLFQGDLSQAGRIIKNRASIPASTAVNMIWNTNRYGRPLGGKDVYGREIPTIEQFANYAGEASNVVVPPYVRAMKDLATGRVGNEEALLGGFELPLRYANIPKDPHRRRPRRRYRSR